MGLSSGAVEAIVNEADMLMYEENMNFLESADPVELSIAASEALVINELLKNDSFSGSCIVSAILEASLHVKKARLELLKDSSCGSVHLFDEAEDLSDLDDNTMENAFEDVGVNLYSSPGCEVSQVKDTFDSESRGCSDDDAAQACSITKSTVRANAFTQAHDRHLPILTHSPERNFQKNEMGHCLSNTAQEIFQRHCSGSACKNELKTMKCSIRKAFVGENSFFSESADTAVSKMSVSKNHSNHATVASPLRIYNENFPKPVSHGLLASQDGKASPSPFDDPLCSVVPCSLSENQWCSPSVFHEGGELPRNVTLKHQQDIGETPIQLNEVLVQHDRNILENIIDKESADKFSRKRISFGDNSKAVSDHLKVFSKDCQQERGKSEREKFLSRENQHWASLQAETQDAELLNAQMDIDPFGMKTALPQSTGFRKVLIAPKTCYAKATSRRSQHCRSNVRRMDKFKEKNIPINGKRRLVFQNIEFLLTGFSEKKEREIENLIRKYGGVVLTQIPSVYKKIKRRKMLKVAVLPVVLCLKKIQSPKFFYGCASNAHVLKYDWLLDSIAAGVVLPPKRYMILSRKSSQKQELVYSPRCYRPHSLIFNDVGIMLLGKAMHFTGFGTMAKHGGAQVFKTLQKLIKNLEAGRISMGVIISDGSSASRHLKQCALETGIHTTSIHWIIRSLYAGRLIPLEEKMQPPPHQASRIPRPHAINSSL